MMAAKRILRYVQGTISMRICYMKGDETRLLGYNVDSDYAEDVNDQKSTAGNVFMMGEGAVSWSSKNQPIVILSITEAKFLAAAFGSCQIMWQQNIFEEIGVA